jgi:hypothetical protein
MDGWMDGWKWPGEDDSHFIFLSSEICSLIMIFTFIYFVRLVLYRNLNDIISSVRYNRSGNKNVIMN